MTEFSESLSKWFSKQHKWLQFAAERLLEQDNITPNDILEFFILCQQEAKGQLGQPDWTFPNDAFAKDSEGTIRLCSLSNIEGVNALAPRKPLEFGKNNITVIYGLNGSGKSGYVRLLKHMCGASYPGALHQNVYNPSPKEQKATIIFEKDGIPVSHDWKGQLSIDELKSVDIFDTSFGVFMNADDEVSYEPPVLSYFSSLISICEKVGEKLDTEASRYPSKKPNISTELRTTAESIWFDSISHETCTAEVEEHCTFTDENNQKVKELQQRLAEQDPATKANLIRKQKEHIDALLQDAQKYLDQLSDENCHRIIDKGKNASLLKKCAVTAAQKIFNEEPLKDIGSDIWKELWIAAQEYSKKAYKDQEFPNISENSRCVLCQQELSREAKVRLSSFNEFVKGEMQKKSLNADREFKKAIEALANIPSLDLLKTRMDAAGINHEEISISLKSFFTSLKERKESLQALESTDDLPAITCEPIWIDKAKKLSADYAEQAEKYDKDSQSDNHILLKNNLIAHLAKKWLSEHRNDIELEIERLKKLNQIQKAKKLINTKSLSNKKGELAEVLITEAFVQRFNAELKNLRMRLRQSRVD